MLRDLVTQKCVYKKTVTDFRYPRACRLRKYQIENRSPELPRPFKSIILYCIRSKNVSYVFHDLKNVKIATQSLKICQFWTILTNFSYIL
jgi:hypothetical protein